MRLRALAGRSREDPGGEGETVTRLQRVGVGHDGERSGVVVLDAPLVVTLDRRGDRARLEAGTGRVGVTVDQTYDPGLVTRYLGADHEADRLAGLDAPAVAVTDRSAWSLRSWLRPDSGGAGHHRHQLGAGRLRRGGIEDLLAQPHEDDAVGDAHDVLHVVADEDAGHAVCA